MSVSPPNSQEFWQQSKLAGYHSIAPSIPAFSSTCILLGVYLAATIPMSSGQPELAHCGWHDHFCPSKHPLPLLWGSGHPHSSRCTPAPTGFSHRPSEKIGKWNVGGARPSEGRLPLCPRARLARCRGGGCRRAPSRPARPRGARRQGWARVFLVEIPEPPAPPRACPWAGAGRGISPGRRRPAPPCRSRRQPAAAPSPRPPRPPGRWAACWAGSASRSPPRWRTATPPGRPTRSPRRRSRGGRRGCAPPREAGKSRPSRPPPTAGPGSRCRPRRSRRTRRGLRRTPPAPSRYRQRRTRPRAPLPCPRARRPSGDGRSEPGWAALRAALRSGRPRCRCSAALAGPGCCRRHLPALGAAGDKTQRCISTKDRLYLSSPLPCHYWEKIEALVSLAFPLLLFPGKAVF